MPNRTGSYERLHNLIGSIRDLKPVIVAFSGGSDSAFLLWACAQILTAGDLTAVTFRSATTPTWEIGSACYIAGLLSVRHILLPGPEMQSEYFLANDLSRCYYCKRERLNFLQSHADILPGAQIIEGSVTDDLEDFRPGMQAVREAGIKSPMLEAGISKMDIALIAKEYNLAFALRPSESCLATRIETGLAINTSLLRKLHNAEEAIHAMGFEQVRVRWNGEQARLEFAADDLPGALAERHSIDAVLHKCGFAYVAPGYSVYRNRCKGGTSQ